jgi:DNA transformation protein and related proteins
LQHDCRRTTDVAFCNRQSEDEVLAVSTEYLEYVLEQLAGLCGVRTIRMFGGIGLYQDERFFGIITSADTLYFKVNDANRGDYEARGMSPFRPPSNRQISMSYYEVPADTLEDSDECVAWARKSVAAAGTRPAGKRASVRRNAQSRPKRKR